MCLALWAWLGGWLAVPWTHREAMGILSESVALGSRSPEVRLYSRNKALGFAFYSCAQFCPSNRRQNSSAYPRKVAFKQLSSMQPAWP